MNRLDTLIVAIILGAGLVLAATVTDARADEGSLSPAEIQQVISKYSGDIRQCYVKHAMPQKTATGKFTLEVLVKASGDVGEVTVDAPGVKGKQLEQCVRDLAGVWRFRESRSATLVQSPFLLLRTRAPGAGPVVSRSKRSRSR